MLPAAGFAMVRKQRGLTAMDEDLPCCGILAGGNRPQPSLAPQGPRPPSYSKPYKSRPLEAKPPSLLGLIRTASPLLPSLRLPSSRSPVFFLPLCLPHMLKRLRPSGPPPSCAAPGSSPTCSSSCSGRWLGLPLRSLTVSCWKECVCAPR